MHVATFLIESGYVCYILHHVLVTYWSTLRMRITLDFHRCILCII